MELWQVLLGLAGLGVAVYGVWATTRAIVRLGELIREAAREVRAGLESHQRKIERYHRELKEKIEKKEGEG